MSSKITIIGAGSVGSTIAYTLSNEDIASEIVLIDINKKKVEGEVMDIAQGTCFRDPVSIIAGEYEDDLRCDIFVRQCIGDRRSNASSSNDVSGYTVGGFRCSPPYPVVFVEFSR